MHRHGYVGRKFGRERDQRRALLTGLQINLFEHADKGIKTTLPKAKEIRRHAEKLISKARKGGLANRRIIISKLGNNVKIGNLLVDTIAPQITRTSGYLRVIKLDEARRGDNAPMARIEFVDTISFEAPKKAEKKVEAKKPAAPKKAPVKK